MKAEKFWNRRTAKDAKMLCDGVMASRHCCASGKSGDSEKIDMKFEKIVAELADIRKMLEMKGVKESLYVRQLAELGSRFGGVTAADGPAGSAVRLTVRCCERGYSLGQAAGFHEDVHGVDGLETTPAASAAPLKVRTGERRYSLAHAEGYDHTIAIVDGVDGLGTTPAASAVPLTTGASDKLTAGDLEAKKVRSQISEFRYQTGCGTWPV
jgi:hypothetical protein